MRSSIVVVAMLCLILVVGCSPEGDATRDSTARPAPVAEEPAAEATNQVESVEEVPLDDPSLPREDSSGRSASQAVEDIVAATNAGDWAARHSLYANPPVSLAQVTAEWQDSNMQYEQFKVLETRVPREDLAFVRVTYRVTSDLPDGQLQTNDVTGPGSWWAVEKVDGNWKVRWMPAQ
ncbi:MAG: hypothetical protein M1617_08650 [Actinobacteria bacterium]|nr:hypothetical protein [Actinomycetota bacterium]MCL5888328.1 hypothetical protein [Actinomycetota bacterium]